MNRADGTLQYRRLRAPKHHGERLIDPPLEAAPQIVLDNCERAASREFDFHGRSFRELSQHARSELLAAAAQYTRQYRDVETGDADAAAPIVMSGHQPELFHPGVWFKNFVLDRLARKQAACAIHLLIDNDTCRTPSIRVPTGTIDAPRVESIDYDERGDEMPFEERDLIDPSRFNSFDHRASKTISPFISEPLLPSFWPFAVEAARQHRNLGRCLAQARHCQEAAWGLQTLELPLSHVCDGIAFRWFTLHILSHLTQFKQIHNAALLEYRQVNGVRSHSHPVPELVADGDWLEAPFWIWSSESKTRRRLFARPVSEGVEITDRERLRVTLPIAHGKPLDRAAEVLAEHSQSGVKIRSRALLTTMFARLFLCDLFIHGIGGAKYDELTDVIIDRFFGWKPPTFLIVTATAKLPIVRPSERPDALREMDRLLRELRFNPQRHVASNQDAEALVAAKQRWIETPAHHGNLRERHLEIARINEALQPHVQAKRNELHARRATVLQQLRIEKVLGSREYSFCLFPIATLQSLLLDK